MNTSRCDQLPPEALEELFSSLANWISSSGLLLLMLNAAMNQAAVANRVAVVLNSLQAISSQLEDLIAEARKREAGHTDDPPDDILIQ